MDEEEINTDQHIQMRGIRSRLQNIREAEEASQCFIEKQIGPDDTLQSLALKYGCKVADLKTANNLIRDQDFHALTIIKVPVKRHGLLMELHGSQFKETVLNAVASNGTTVATSSPPYLDSPVDSLDHINWAANLVEEEDDSSDNASETDHLVREVSIKSNFQSQSKEAANFLHQMDKDIKNILTNSHRKSRRSSNSKRPSYLHYGRLVSASPKSNDNGVRWWTLIIIMIIVALVTPTVYLLYFDVYKKSSSDQSLNTPSANHTGHSG